MGGESYPERRARNEEGLRERDEALGKAKGQKP